ncbi:TetR/AcrR family transcriptional regulator [Thalassococcus sp. S3]|uniref:TetR/AcrR family transcriptional regulator n=1 Tax=Thalassococcus sp. S3 TaxID=2017482 RepID=UPI0010241A7D|nr:TetR/AcrR family transcriptional regulator [Thalassococcus sp. S3]QBF32645.1 hypothetical protein CFI11_15675 [Thalassococcus sp. S3]
MRTKDEAKRHAIREAAIAAVVAGGLGGASIAEIAKRAGLSQGTIYLYFSGKDELFDAVFLDVKREIHARLMAAAHAGGSAKEAIRGMWLALFDHASERPADFAFAEHLSAARMLDGRASPEIDAMAQEVAQIIEQAVLSGTLVDLPTQTLSALLSGPALQMARRSVVRKEPPSKDELDLAFEAIWRGIAR